MSSQKACVNWVQKQQRFEHHDSSAGQEGRDFLRSTVTRCCSSTNSWSLSYSNDLLFSSAYTVRLLSFDSFARAAGSTALCYTLVQFDPNYIPSIWACCFVPHDESTSSQLVRSVSLVLDVSSTFTQSLLSVYLYLCSLTKTIYWVSSGEWQAALELSPLNSLEDLMKAKVN